MRLFKSSQNRNNTKQKRTNKNNSTQQNNNMKFSTTFTLIATTLMLTGTNARIGSGGDYPKFLDNSISHWGPDSILADDSYQSYCKGNNPGFKRSQTVNKYYCAASDDLLDTYGCGKCFKISYNGSASVYPGNETKGTKGDAIIQVIDRNAEAKDHFDCIDSAFKEITGLITDRFPMTYEPMDSCPP